MVQDYELFADTREGFAVPDGDFYDVPETNFRTVGLEIAVGTVWFGIRTDNDAVLQKKDNVAAVLPYGFVSVCVVQDN
ncbi:MAG: hypothetical protein J6C42_02835 [Clostridia bacterium]|nr:hypothetical protein [Clostridia bacterium]